MEAELEAELSLAGTALGDELSDGVAGDATEETTIKDWAAKRAFLGA